MIKVAVLGLVAVILAIQLKKTNPELALFISIAGCVLICTYGIVKLEYVLDALDTLVAYIEIPKGYISVLFKIVGITFVSEFAADLCKDAGHAAVGNQIEFAGRISIIAISMPILLALVKTIDNLM